MTAGDVAAILTGLGVICTAGVTLVTHRELKRVHVLVNSRMSETVDRVRQLHTALYESGTAVPPAPPAHEREE